MSHIDDGIVSNPTDNPRFSDILDAALSRRTILIGGVAVAATTFLGGRPGAGVGDAQRRRAFLPVPGVPAGFPFFDDDGDFDRAWSVRGRLLVQNHEYTDDGLLFPDGVANWNAAKTAKSLAAHGVSVIQLRRTRRDGWQVRRPPVFARRITGSTPITLRGPAAGRPLLRTSADPTGRRVLGTLNNCAHGYTPWKTYLACEENFNGYFRAAPAPGTPGRLRPTADRSAEPAGQQRLRTHHPLAVPQRLLREHLPLGDLRAGR